MRTIAELAILRKAREKFREKYGHDTDLWQELEDDAKKYPEQKESDNGEE